MKFSSKVEKCGLSPMRKFHPYAVAAKARGINIYHLNIGQPDVQTPPAFFEAVRHFEQPVLAYAPSPGIPKLIERFSPAAARTPDQLAATLAEFTARYDAHKEDKTAPYPGIPELLAALKAEGIRTAVFSNKADPLCGKIIAHYFGADSFSIVRGNRPGVPTKPDPTGVYALMQDLGAEASSTLFVGDSDVDILTGHNAGLPAVGVLWGFRGEAELTEAGADALAAVPADILAYVHR